VIRQAISLHQKGQLAEAASLYRENPRQRNPQQRAALHRWGVIGNSKKESLGGWS